MHILTSEPQLCTLLYSILLLITLQWIGEHTRCVASRIPEYHDYLIIGAGPAGLQLGYYLEQSGRDYLLLEQANISGNFFTTYPRHDRMISINKRFTGKSNKEFNMRHDWNSLLSHDESLLFKEYTHEFFPPRPIMVDYLNDFQRKLNINVRHNVHIRGIKQSDAHNLPDSLPRGKVRYIMRDQEDRIYLCNTLVIGTGLSVPIQPSFLGSKHVEGYESISTDPKDYEGQTVLILGGGNAAFEVADSIYGSTNLVHMLRRSRARLSWSTHYVGDLRAVNNNLLDTYQLKSLDAALEADVEDLIVTKQGNKFLVSLQPDGPEINTTTDLEDWNEELRRSYDNFAMREPYDKIIRCLGFAYDPNIFEMPNATGLSGQSKYPEMKHNYESPHMPGLYYAGGLAHMLDYRKSSGGFIHGIRYTARALSKVLELENHQVHWPSTSFSLHSIVPSVLKMMNEASGIYQMFGFFGNIITIDRGTSQFRVYEDFPVNLLHDFHHYAGRQVGPVIVLILQYGSSFSGPGKDTFKENRAVGEPSDAHLSNFLHPVFYYYDTLPTEIEMDNRLKDQLLPRPDRVHHIVEDFLTSWDAPSSHILPLRRFLETVLDHDLRQFHAEDCLEIILTHGELPRMCHEDFLAGQGLTDPLEL